MPRLVIGSRNLKKRAEIEKLIVPPGESSPRLRTLEIVTIDAIPGCEGFDVEETAETFEGNAQKKASEFAIKAQSWVLADDSGLSVDALDGAPGVYSARYAGSHGDNDANNAKLLDVMANLPDDQRGARFVAVLALADPSGKIHATVRGECRGRIIRSLAGHGGFGYDPLFLIPEYHRTFGELAPITKSQLSHRARAFQKLRPVLDHLLATGEFL